MKKNFTINYIIYENIINPILIEEVKTKGNYYMFYNKTNEYNAYLSSKVDKVNNYLNALVFNIRTIRLFKVFNFNLSNI